MPKIRSVLVKYPDGEERIFRSVSLFCKDIGIKQSSLHYAMNSKNKRIHKKTKMLENLDITIFNGDLHGEQEPVSNRTNDVYHRVTFGKCYDVRDVITCECGASFQIREKGRHIKSSCHKNYMTSLSLSSSS